MSQRLANHEEKYGRRDEEATASSYVDECNAETVITSVSDMLRGGIYDVMKFEGLSRPEIDEQLANMILSTDIDTMPRTVRFLESTISSHMGVDVSHEQCRSVVKKLTDFVRFNVEVKVNHRLNVFMNHELISEDLQLDAVDLKRTIVKGVFAGKSMYGMIASMNQDIDRVFGYGTAQTLIHLLLKRSN